MKELEDSYKVEYYYDRPERMWRIDIIDENNNIVEYDYTYSEQSCIKVAENYKDIHNIISIRKVNFYR